MATTIVSTSTTPTLADFKTDCRRLYEFLSHNGSIAATLSPGTAQALYAIFASGDTTDLRTT